MEKRRREVHFYVKKRDLLDLAVVGIERTPGHMSYHDARPNSQSRPLELRSTTDVIHWVTKSIGKRRKIKVFGGTNASNLLKEFSNLCQANPSSVPREEEGVKMELLASRLPWLMFADDPSNSSGTSTFFNLADKKTYKIELPEAQGKRCIGSSNGWLITIDINLDIVAFNPFTRARIQLPPQPTFEYQHHQGRKATPEFRRDIYIRKSFLSSSRPSCEASDSCIALAIHSQGNLAFCRPGSSTAWTTIASPDFNPFTDAIFYQGRFYAISFNGTLVVCELGEERPTVKEILSGPTNLYLLGWTFYLVVAGDTLLLVARDIHFGKKSYRTRNFKVFALVHGELLQWKKVRSLVNSALFVGGNSSMCFSADELPECKRNCIYFTDDLEYCPEEDGPGSDVGVFNYGEGTIEPLYPGVSRSKLWPPIWVKRNLTTVTELQYKLSLCAI